MDRALIASRILSILQSTDKPVTAVELSKQIGVTRSEINSVLDRDLKSQVTADRTNNPPKWSLVSNNNVIPTPSLSYSHLATIVLIDADTISDYSGVGIYFTTQELDFDVDSEVITCEDTMISMSWHIHSVLNTVKNITIRSTNPQAVKLANIVNQLTSTKVTVTK